MDDANLHSMLSGIQGIRHACDLDLLLFFRRHPLALLTSEQLVVYLGYERERVARSLDGLIEAGLLTRSQNPTHAARLYVLGHGGSGGGLLAALLDFASTRQGRRDVMRLLEPHGPRRGASVMRIAKAA